MGADYETSKDSIPQKSAFQKDQADYTPQKSTAQNSQESGIETILAKIEALDLAPRKKGSAFERVCRQLLKERDSANAYKDIVLWADWDKRDGNDRGIDIIIQSANGEYIAVQCKFFTSKKVDLPDLATYFTQLQSGVGEVKFSKGIIIATSDFSANAIKGIEQIRRQMPIELITLDDLKNSNINWVAFDPLKFSAQSVNSATNSQSSRGENENLEQDLPLKPKKQPREHQKEAIEKTKAYFKDPTNTRGKLIMACGTGKTFTSLKIIEMLVPQTAENKENKIGIALFIAPSIALVGQTFREYCREKSDDFVACIVCSDEKSGTSDDDISPSELPLTPSTSPSDIKAAYDIAQKSGKKFIIFSTYQSAIRIKEAQSAGFLGEIDLMICDEAHRSVGAMYSSTQQDTLNAFTLCHKDENIKAKRRIYMTATPRVYSNASKAKGLESGNEVFSMDDEDIFGQEIYALNFAKAIHKGLLADYKVIILAIRQDGMASVANKAIAKLKSQNENLKLDEKLIDLEFVCKIIGTHKGLAKTDLIALDENGEKDNDFIEEMDKNVSKRAINFCRSIKASKNITTSFKAIIESYDEVLKRNSFKNLDISIDHIDGTMNAKLRLDKLNALNSPAQNACNILSNARCLSEGVDVPALDSVVFFDGKSAQVDIIQSVGRVMRKAQGTNKTTGYIILPIALSENELKNLDQAVSNTNFQSIWAVLKALRSHDETLVDESVFKEKIKIAISDIKGDSKDKKDKDEKPDTPYEATLFDAVTLSQLADTMYNAIPTKLGDRGYWQSFSAKTAKIVEKLNARLSELFAANPEILAEFLASLKENIHPNIKESEAMDMICSHIITKPIFDALFGNDLDENPISKALEAISERLHKLGLDGEETRSLNALYKSVGENAKLAKSEKAKQELIKNLYDTFFRTAFKKQAEKLGIVYTPLSVVDFILNSVNFLLKKHFGVDFNDDSVKVFDPFTGTGSFITRLLSKELNLIKDEKLAAKFNQGIFAQDIVLLAYYIALINITQIAASRDKSLKNFAHICLADSLDYLESKRDFGLFEREFKDLEANKRIKNLIANENIKVIIGNPPYSGGASSANDNNANLSHPNLEKRVKETYGKDSAAMLAKNTRDTLIQAIRMSSDTIKDSGIIGFVVNGGFIDSSSADGFRKCVGREFSEIYVLNLRGNARTSGDKRKKEGDGVFDSGSRASVAIVFFVKSPQNSCQIHYHDIGDYLSREAKLARLDDAKSLENIAFTPIIPNAKGDWINQQNTDFDDLLPLKNEKNEEGIFLLNSTGLVTGRDAWAWNFSKNTIKNSLNKAIATYNEDLAKFDREKFTKKCENLKSVNFYQQLDGDDISTDTTRIAWTRSLKNRFIKGEKAEKFDENKIRLGFYRPFVKSHLYFDKVWSEGLSQFPQLFPTKHSENVLILTSLMATKDFSSLAVNGIADLQTLSNTQAFPLYFYDTNGERHYAISDYALSEFEKRLGFEVKKDEIFYYIYALFHHRGFCEKYKFELCKQAPRVCVSKNFKALSTLGQALAALHLNYESGQKHSDIEFKDGVLTNTQDPTLYKLNKMIKSADSASIIFNPQITIKNIPARAYEYKINARSVLDILIERYALKTDKASLIINDPNEFEFDKFGLEFSKNSLSENSLEDSALGGGVNLSENLGSNGGGSGVSSLGGGKYAFELLCRIIPMCVKSVQIIDEISKINLE